MCRNVPRILFECGIWTGCAVPAFSLLLSPFLPPSGLCSRGTPSQDPLFSSCFDLTGQNLPSSLFCPTSNFFCTALVHSPSNPCGYCCFSVHTNAWVRVCVRVRACVCSLIPLCLLSSSSTQADISVVTERHNLKSASRYMISLYWYRH